MGNLENYRSSTDYREILRILQKATTLEENFLWQPLATRKNIIPINHFEIDFVTREVVVYFDYRKFTIDQQSALYIKLDYRTSVFKIKDYRQTFNSIHFTFPLEIKTLELRSVPRHLFLPNQEKVISIKPSLSGNRESGNELHVRALDVSHQGLGLIISEQNRSFLKNNRILWITRLGENTLQTPILSEIVYLNNEIDPKFQNRKQKTLKVGVKLSGFIPNHVYQKFIQ